MYFHAFPDRSQARAAHGTLPTGRTTAGSALNAPRERSVAPVLHSDDRREGTGDPTVVASEHESAHADALPLTFQHDDGRRFVSVFVKVPGEKGNRFQVEGTFEHGVPARAKEPHGLNGTGLDRQGHASTVPKARRSPFQARDLLDASAAGGLEA